MLTIDNAVKIFSPNTPNEHTALDGLNLHLNKGEFVTMVGSNGSGKSTLFNSICGNFLLDKGFIEVDGKDITFMREHIRAGFVGRVFQDPMKGTAPNLTIEENLALAYSRSRSGPFGIAVRKSDRDFFAASLSEFGMGLEDRMKTKVGLLSGGQRQVVTLLMCTLVTPKLLLLDEHTAALDPATAEKVMDITRKIVERNNLTTLMITHNLKSALRTGSRTIMMDSGKIILDISGKERDNMTLDDLLNMYSLKKNETLDNDRMLLN
ncbi:Bicarbonate transport ATP-binding protein CmpD [bioreactor metagenome]|uniref:Bicarbonate transport ATP-binding protein CmpD n=1 Tax=bioreactor metagenome TaxID=1076179 RepID=A0A645DPG6_9ZZZZ|nr:ATP-binding cassette domain-containing protein [Candidatus Metalachnospira sp.]